MQWADALNGGFSDTSRQKDLRRPVIKGGDFGYERVNVDAQQRDPASLLAWFERALLTLRECPEFGIGSCHYVDTGTRAVLALIHDAPAGTMLAVTNLGPTKQTVDLALQDEQEGDPTEVLADRNYEPVRQDLTGIDIAGYGYRWIRLRRTMGARAGSTRR
jgi:maltose alpha-D-glucosyltransferase/alpha-amylase